MTKEWYIYGLALRGDWEIRYVGSTKDLQKRFCGHMNEWKARDGDKNEWVKANLDRVEIRLLEVVKSDRKLAERRMAQKLYAEGHRLFNIRRPRRLTKKERAAQVAYWVERTDVSPAEAPIGLVPESDNSDSKKRGKNSG